MAVQSRIILLLCLLLYALSLTSAQPSLVIQPDVMAEGLFLGQSFTRLCSLSEAQAGDIFFEWLLNDVVIHSGLGTNLELSIPSVTFDNEGRYSCRATLGDTSVIMATSGGELFVFDTGMIHAPPVQYVEHGVSSQLNCSFPDALTSWSREGESVVGDLVSPSFNDEGVYLCDLFVQDALRRIQASIQREIRLHVFVPVDILHYPPPYTRLEGNPAHTLRVAFSGRQAQNMTIIWQRDGIPLANSLINNTYSPSQLSGTTELKFTRITRSQSGVYRVIIRSLLGSGVYDRRDTEEEVSFQVDVKVPPASPSDFIAQDVYSNNAVFQWTLTNQNTDEGADMFIIRLAFSNGAHFRDEIFLGGVSERRVDNLIPGTNFTAQLIARNPDGESSVGPITFSTTPGNPRLNDVSVVRRNATHFTAQLSLAYTGGGDIIRVVIRVSNYQNTNEAEFEVVPYRNPNSELVWNADVAVTDPSLIPEERLSFMILARNEYSYTSEGLSEVVPAFNPTMMTTMLPSPTAPSQIDSTILILIAGVCAGIMLIILIVVIIIIAICCRKKRTKNSTKYSVNNTTGDAEKQLDSDNPLVTRGDTLEKTQTISLHSLPSVHSISNCSEKSNQRYIEQMSLGHRRVPSDASSKASSNPSHSITSNSPNTMMMIKKRNERNLYGIESTTSLSNDSEIRSQLSQTESETMIKPGSYIHARLTPSTCSSTHSSQQSIPRNVHRYEPVHGRNYSFSSSIIKEEDIASERFDHSNSQQLGYRVRPNQYHNHPLSHHSQVPLSVSGSEMDARAMPPETGTALCTCQGVTSPEYVYMSSASSEFQASHQGSMV